MRRPLVLATLVLATLVLSGCDTIAGRTLAPEERCRPVYTELRGVNAAGDSVALGAFALCLMPGVTRDSIR